MSETVYSIGEFPGHKRLQDILDSGPMPEPTATRRAIQPMDPLEWYLVTVEEILEDLGYPTTSIELESLICADLDSGSNPDDLMMRFTTLLRLAHRTRAAWRNEEICEFGYYMGQLAKVTAEAKFFEQLEYTNSGLRLRAGALKSALTRIERKGSKPEHLEVLRYARSLLAVGRQRHELTSLVHRKFSHKDGYPKSKKQYRTILSPILKNS